MRVIAGEFKGRHLKAVSGSNTRPTSDKIKESVFHMLGPFFKGGLCLDLFAGSGSLGIEAISRGMDKGIFVDKSSSAIRVIHKNVEMLKIKSQCEIYRNDAYRALQIMSKKNLRFDLIILDPPYDRGHYQKVIDYIVEKELLLPTGQLYIEHRPEKKITFNATQVERKLEKKYNETTSITIFEKKK